MRLRPTSGPSHSPDARLLRRVRWQLVAWSGGVTLAVLVGLGALLYSTVAGSLDTTGRDQLMGRASSIARIIATATNSGRGGNDGTGNGAGGGPPGGPPIGLAFGGQQSGTFAIVVDPSGSSQGPADFNLPDGLPDKAGIAAARTGVVDVRNTAAAGIPVRILSLAVARSDGQYVVQVVGDRTAEQRTLSLLLTVLVLGGVAAIGLSVLAGSVYARRALQSIRDSLRRQREFAADASHELRTPIAVIKSSLEMARRSSSAPTGEALEIMDDIAAEADQLNRLVDDLLLLARADSGVVELDAKPIDVVDAAEDALGSIGALARARGISVTLDPLPTPIAGDAARIRQVVVILVDNAIRHSPDGGSVTIRIRPVGAGGEIAVEDEGSGIRAEDLPRVFDRFWRSADGSGGTGLGLSIAAWIASRHGGTVRVENVPPHGARFTVTLPGRPPAQT